MTISEIKPSNVFTFLSQRTPVVCVDFKRGEYTSLEGQTVGAVQRMMEDTDGCKFYVIKTEEAQS